MSKNRAGKFEEGADSKHMYERACDDYMEEEYKKWEDEYEPGDIKSMRFYGIKRK